MADSNTELRPCPFCKAHGADNISLMMHSCMGDDGEFYDIEYSVKCVQCGAQVYAEYKSEVADLWNGVNPNAEET